MDAEPERAGQAMADVADTARGALVELRRLLGVLRSEHDFAPQPGLDAIDELVDTVRRAGMDVRLRVRSMVRSTRLPGLTAYRVVQEALTNVLKHAGPCATRCRALSVSDDALIVCVVDDGAGPRCRRRTATGWSACGNGCRCWAARSTRARCRRAGSPCARAAVVGMTIRVVVVDDQELVRSGFAMILDAQDDIEVVGEADDGDTAVEVAHAVATRRGADGRAHAADGRHHRDAGAGRSRASPNR